MSEPEYQEDAPVEESVDYEAEARKQGWVPEEEWKGDSKPKEFVDAKTFVERGKEIDDKLKSKISNLETKLENVERSAKEFREFNERALKKEREEREALMKQLEEQREQAITEGDGQTFTQVDRQLNELRSNEPAPDQNELGQMAQEWLANNRWYETNKKLHYLADGIADDLQREGYVGQAYFNELTRRVRELEPGEFETPKPPPAVEGGRASGQSEPEPRSFESLDKESKAAFDRFFKSGFYGDDLKKAKAEYLANYDWD